MTTAQALPIPTVSLIEGRPATTSIAISKHFSKDHGKVIRDIRNLIAGCPNDFTEANFGLSKFIDPTGRSLPMYTVHFDGFILLVMGYTGKKALGMKLAYIAAFNAMREQLEAQSLQKMQQLPASDAPLTPDQQCTLKAMVRALVEKGGHYAAIWSRFNNHFRLGSYKQLPQARMSEAVDYLMRFEVASKALPASTPSASESPAELAELPDTRRLFKDIQAAADRLSPCGNWTHLAVRLELGNISTTQAAHAVGLHVNAAWHALGLARSSLLAALAVSKIGR